MRQVVYVFVGAMLIVAPGTGNAAQRSDRFNALRQIAMGIGSVSGAASVCREISWPRMKVLTGKFSDLLRTSVTDSEEFSSIQQAYDQSTIEGQLNVASRQVDCAVAVRDLAELERAVTSLPPAAVATGASAPPAAVTTGAAPSPALPTTSAAVAQPARADAHKADARTASKEASTGEPSDASNLQRGKTTPASRAPYWERRGRHERGAAAGGYTMSPPSTAFAPPSYGVGAAGGDPGGLY